ncbi:hypothetical protein KR018_004816, partial [Drosophila ironensis]
SSSLPTLVMYFCLFLIFLTYAQSENRNYRIVFDKAKISYVDTELFEKFEVQLVEINNRSCIDAAQILKQRVESLMLHAVLDFWKGNTQHMRVYDINYNWCDLSDWTGKNRLIKNYGKALLKFAAMKPKCPLEANVTFEVKNLYFDEMDFPSFVPLGKFRSLYEYVVDQKTRASLLIYGRVISWADS